MPQWRSDRANGWWHSARLDKRVESLLDVAVRGGGHNVAGHATIDGGLMIDLMPMKGIHVGQFGFIG